MRTRSMAGIGLLAVGALALASCSAAEAPVDETGAGKLSILTIGSADSALGKFITQFGEENPDIELDVTYAPPDTIGTTLRTQLSAGTAADVFLVLPGRGSPMAMNTLQEGGYLADLSDYEFSGNMKESMDTITKVDGKRYMLPVSVGAIGLMYNQTAVEEAGVTIPTTWDEVIDYCDAANAAGKIPFAYGAQSAGANTSLAYSLAATLVYAENPEFEADVKSGETTFADSDWSKVFDRITDMVESDCFQPDILSTSLEVTKDLFGSGDALATVATLGLMGIAPEGTKFIAVGMPATDNASDTWMSAGPSAGYAVNAAVKNPIGAQRFVDAFGDPESMAAVAAVSGTFPSISSAFEITPEIEDLAAHLDAGTVYPWMDQLWPNPKVSLALTDGIQQYLGGKATAEQVLAEMDKAYAE